MCIKETSKNFSEAAFVETENPENIRDVFTHGGRKHYIVWCDDCQKTHEYIGHDTGVIPVQPALGWFD